MIRRLLCFLYTTGYNDEPYDDESKPPTVIQAPAYVNRLYLNAQMYSTGDKYDIPSLKEKAVEKFDTAIWEMYANKRKNPPIGPDLVDEIIVAIPHIYRSTPDTDRRLRDRVVHSMFYRGRDFEYHPQWQDLVAAVPELREERKRVI